MPAPKIKALAIFCRSVVVQYLDISRFKRTKRNIGDLKCVSLILDYSASKIKTTTNLFNRVKMIQRDFLFINMEITPCIMPIT